jgi:glutathione synthase/RimK-type ligase-like ATP-grasp enzyme
MLNGAVVHTATQMSGLWRRPSWPLVDLYAPDSREFVASESVDAFDGALDADCIHWLNKPEAVRRAEFKLRQLMAAKAIGIKTPATVVTNEATVAMEFAARFPRVVAKPVRYGLVSTDAPLVAWTTGITANELRDLAGPPVMLQERISAAFHVRVVTVGNNVFVATLRTRDLDWRTDLKNHGHFLPAESSVASEVADMALRLSRSLGLGFTAQDWIAPRDGAFTFLEANPNGQWLFLDPLWAGGITDTLALRLEEDATEEVAA